MAAYVFHLLGNAHLDPVWLWDWREGLNEGLITCRTILDLMDEDPELTFSRGESLIYEHLEAADPATFARMRRQVEAGRWEPVGGTYLQADHNLPDTETLLRQYLAGQEYFRTRFGRIAEVGWAADCFGHAAGLPDIMASAGIRYFACTRPEPRDYPLAKPAFRWIGAGGAEILAYRPPVGWYGAEREEMPRRLDGLLAEAAGAGLRHVGVFYGLGNHGGGPTRRQLAEARAWAVAHPEVELRFSTMHGFFRELEAELAGRPADFLPVLHGEFNFCLRGCYSSLARIKFAYRRAQAQLQRAERTASVIAARLGTPPANLAGPWQSVLFNAFHDILPGSCIERAADDQAAHLGVALHGAQSAEFAALNALAAQVDTRVVPSPRPDCPTAAALLVWNPQPQLYQGFVELEACLDWRPIPAYRHRLDELPVQVLDAAKRPLPFQLVATESPRVMPDIPWRKRAVVPVTLPPLGWSVFELGWVEGAVPPPLPAGLAPASSPRANAIANSWFTVAAEPGGRGIAIERLGRPFLSGDGLAAAVFADPFGSWGAGESVPGATDFSTRLETWSVARVEVLESGPWRAALWVRLAGERSHLDLTLSLYAGADRLEVAARALWNEPAARLKLLLPAEAAEVCYEVPGGNVARPACGEVPGGRWAQVRGAAGPLLGFASDALYNFDLKAGVFRATVVRSSGYAYSGAMQPGQPWLPPADAGELKLRFVLAGPEADLPALAQNLEQPPLTVPVPAKPGALPPADSLMTVSPAGLRVLAFKPAEDGQGWVLRLQETAGRKVAPHLEFLGTAVELGELAAGGLGTWRLTGWPAAPRVTRCDTLERPL